MTSKAASEPAPGGPELRADAARNVRRIVDTAMRLLAEHPGIGVAEIAAAAGVARATVYRHFPSREELVTAIRTQAFDDFEAAVAGARLSEGAPLDALRRMIDRLIEVGDRYLYLLAETPGGTTGAPRLEREERMRKPVLDLIERGQRSGELTSELPPRWMTYTMAALISAALQAIAEGEMKADEAAEVVHRTLVRGFSGRA